MAADNPVDGIPTTLNYSLPNPMGTSLYAVHPRPDSMTFRTNYIVDTRGVVVRNLRGRENEFSLDENGFQFLVHHTDENFLDQGSIETNYYAEVRELLIRETGAHQVLVLGHKIRQGRVYDTPTTVAANGVQERPPAHSVHADRTPDSVITTVRTRLGRDGERLLQGRVRFINVWRPIGQAVYCEPLAVADWQSSSNMSDLMPVHVETADESFDGFAARFNKKHEWYYLRHQTPSEITLIKCSDNHADNCARLCLHSAFHDPESEKAAPRRRSIEVNTIVFG